MTLPPKETITALKRAAIKAADEISRINTWNKAAVPTA